MSRQNKVNKNNYDQGGRLTPDEMARERVKQSQVSGRAKRKANLSGKLQEHGGPASSRPRSAPEE